MLNGYALLYALKTNEWWSAVSNGFNGITTGKRGAYKEITTGKCFSVMSLIWICYSLI